MSCGGDTDVERTHQPEHKPRRAAIYLSQRDRDALAAGKQPSWEESADVVDRAEPPRAAGPNDRRLLEDVPPHY